jgi:hypothetical protein
MDGLSLDVKQSFVIFFIKEKKNHHRFMILFGGKTLVYKVGKNESSKKYFFRLKFPR